MRICDCCLWINFLESFLIYLLYTHSLTHSGCIMPLFKLYNKKNLFPSCVTKFIYKSHSIMEYNNIKRNERSYIERKFLSISMAFCHRCCLFVMLYCCFSSYIFLLALKYINTKRILVSTSFLPPILFSFFFCCLLLLC